MDSTRFSRGEFGYLIGVPLAWAVLLLFHPVGGEDEYYAGVQGHADRWLVVHIGMMLFIPLMAGAILLLVRGIESRAATVCRIAAPVFALFYVAWEVLLGIGTGILVKDVEDLPADERATGEEIVNDFTESILVRDFGVFVAVGNLALLTTMVAAGIALRGQPGVSVPVSVPVLLIVSAFLISAHPPPFGPIGLLLFVVAVLLYTRSLQAARAPAA
ncbi:hypothetical protein [Jiangella mangrovi]|uniref:DUF4386 family protein n=1 Tax=Jiangella mangrovi TaxID=1524084 RepID=A0A7W9GUE4_9ACTN|nr:hypothetical protein [Jiangella mangrovi]MBB5790219.1 hypothetical protein [Jiangella mangrovi]